LEQVGFVTNLYVFLFIHLANVELLVMKYSTPFEKN